MTRLGRATIYRENNDWTCLETGKLISDSKPNEKIDVCMLHMDGLVKIKGEKVMENVKTLHGI
ncbi:hypothetical protein J2Z83_002514 [Virgibacillus natechei]|uniref:Uncharacterized protein n=1 Tax=Virgibacillus natechei TaxID=1216297 RepID=A0ABS4IHI6_9BACI|nr:hypothetical protein [Virgibacillus natechei]MBP1970396.1 hypothetical protein [Virgibacillus natechei]UZD13217.1 hypothetical protein OLD84_01150 [Virgibacillus natechei]